MKLPLRRAATIGSLLSLATALISGCAEKKVQTAPPPPPDVVVAPVIQKDEPISAEWIGVLDGLVNAQIRAQVTGYLLKQDYTEGQPVKKGDLLFTIDPRTFQATVDQVTANFNKSEIDLKRNADLLKKEAISQQDYDNALAAQLAAKAALDTAKLNLDFTQITSPIDGVPSIATAQIGDLVGPTSGLLTTVSTLDPIKAYFPISEGEYLDFEAHRDNATDFPDGLVLELILADGSVYPEKGKVIALDRGIDANTGTIRIAGSFPNSKLVLRPGQYARIRAVVRTLKNAIEVPQRAVSELQGTYQVYTVDSENKAHLVSVKVGPRVGPNWVITSGLKPDERVIVEGLLKAHDGSPVTIKPASPVAAAPTSAVQ
jgi:membrane fusion protein (multidrug efflux system)